MSKKTKTLVRLTDFDNQTIIDNLLPHTIEHAMRIHQGGKYLIDCIERWKSRKMKYNTKTGMLSDKDGFLGKYSNSEDIPRYDHLEEVVRWEFSGSIGSLFSCYMREGYMNW